MDLTNALGTLKDVALAVAPTVANLVVPGTGALLDQVIRRVAGADKDAPLDEAAAAIAADPNLMLQFKTALINAEVRLAEIRSGKELGIIQAVNTTMQAESKSEHWPQYSWRPFNGFSFPITVFSVYFLLPCFGKTVPSVPELIWIGWMAILGVATWDRGKEKRSAAGDQGDGGMLAGVIKAIQGGAK